MEFHPLSRARVGITDLGELRIKAFVHTRDGIRLVQAVGPRIDLKEVEAMPSVTSSGAVQTTPPVGLAC